MDLEALDSLNLVHKETKPNSSCLGSNSKVRAARVAEPMGFSPSNPILLEGRGKASNAISREDHQRGVSKVFEAIISS